MTLKLLNKGQRIIQLEGGEFGPNQVVSVNKELGEKLLGMYEGELVDLAAHTKDLQDQAKELSAQEPVKPVEVKLEKEAVDPAAKK